MARTPGSEFYRRLFNFASEHSDIVEVYDGMDCEDGDRLFYIVSNQPDSKLNEDITDFLIKAREELPLAKSLEFDIMSIPPNAVSQVQPFIGEQIWDRIRLAS
ncbi:MAG: hypothetical protein Q8L47_00750 [bacterium]|nr:hypothetical protein [bacterium]